MVEITIFQGSIDPHLTTRPRGLPHRATPGLRRMRLGQSGTDVLLPKWVIPSGKLTFCELERSTIFNGSINYFYGNSQ